MGKVHFLRIYLFDPSYFLTNPSEKSCKSFLFFKNATKFTTCREYFDDFSLYFYARHATLQKSFKSKNFIITTLRISILNESFALTEIVIIIIIYQRCV